MQYRVGPTVRSGGVHYTWVGTCIAAWDGRLIVRISTSCLSSSLSKEAEIGESSVFLVIFLLRFQRSLQTEIGEKAGTFARVKPPSLERPLVFTKLFPGFSFHQLISDKIRWIQLGVLLVWVAVFPLGFVIAFPVLTLLMDFDVGFLEIGFSSVFLVLPDLGFLRHVWFFIFPSSFRVSASGFSRTCIVFPFSVFVWCFLIWVFDLPFLS